MLPGLVGPKLYGFQPNHRDTKAGWKTFAEKTPQKESSLLGNKCLRFMIFSNPLIQCSTSLPGLIICLALTVL